MAQPPPGATRSPDGYYWWDESSAQWQPVDDSAADPTISATATASDSATATSSDPGAQASAAADPTEGGGTGVAEHLDVEGTCEGGELSAAEIDDILAAAGVSAVDS